ncbi:KDO2-lipid IV(A) lauroyltransferase [Motilibacter rhizosphaerae]|uniref:KDO2-lipid IV(A) lauroyltransferase n=1 Tax=Motilibacter rhizosphaerae TaxID=598652 RepID=A0A4Q7NQX0_9ACTN|nr:phosphatidylinositol mannoside acyltransferase [Motilibacter rhizosphaerae]RZS89447.1 KDO2-lipid IV(A) lauroyltransferase [Motilibacter rhizosphaerae]
MNDRLVLAAYALGWRAVRLLPERAAYAVFRLLADVAYLRGGHGVQRLRANLARAGAEDRARDGMRSYLRYWCDAFRMAGWSRERVVGSVEPVGDAVLAEALAAGTGFVAALPHTGNWDHAGAWAAAVHAPVVTVAERLRPEELYDRFVAYRRAVGIEVLALGSPGVLAGLREAVREDQIVCLLCDRDLTASGVEVELLGHRARMAPGPALLALQTGAPLHPVTTAYAGERLRVTFHARVPVPEAGTTRERVGIMMQGVADAFSAALREHPEDWHMLQRVFVADLEAHR